MQTWFGLSDQAVFSHTAPSFSTQIRPTLWLWQHLYFMLLQKLEVDKEQDCGTQKVQNYVLGYNLCSRELGNTLHPGFSKKGSNCVLLLSRCLTSKLSGLVCRNAEVPASAEAERCFSDSHPCVVQ